MSGFGIWGLGFVGSGLRQIPNPTPNPESQIPNPKRISMLYAHFTTTDGSFTARLFDAEAPKTVANFVGLAEGTKQWTDPRSGSKEKQPYSNRTVFHRVIERFMIQGGKQPRRGTTGHR